MKSLSRARLLATPWTGAYQAPPSMGFSRQEYWSGVPLPSPKIWNKWTYLQSRRGFPGGASGQELACQCRRHKRHGFDPWVGKIPLRKARQPTPVLLPGESPWTEEPGRLQSMGSQRVGHDWSDLVCMHTQSRNRLTDTEIRLVVGRGKGNEWARSSGLGRGKLTFRMNKQQGPTL